jgi:hypothetical protein
MKQYVIGFSIGVILTLLIFYFFNLFVFTPSISKSKIEHSQKVIIDTIMIEQKSKPIHFSQKGKIVYKNIPKVNDANINSELNTSLFEDTNSIIGINKLEFQSTIDTIYNSDTIHLQYQYPLNMFTLDLKQQNDTIKFQQIVIKQQKESWWLKPAIATSSCIIGLLIGQALK